jgi:hypothetical protein
MRTLGVGERIDLDRRRHHRYAADSKAEVRVLRDVDVESASASALTVLSSTPAVAGSEATIRLTAGAQGHVVLRVRTTQCHPVLIDGRRRFRVLYAVMGPEDRTAA